MQKRVASVYHRVRRVCVDASDFILLNLEKISNSSCSTQQLFYGQLL